MSHLNRFFPLLPIAILCLFSCNDGTQPTAPAITGKDSYAATSIISIDSSRIDDSFLLPRKQRIAKALGQQLPIMLLENIDPNQSLAQLIASSDPRFRQNVRDSQSGEPYLNEIFSIQLARPQERPADKSEKDVYRVEMYNYPLNLTTVALVDIAGQQVISINEFSQTQPDLNKELEDIAISIAIHSPAVIQALGYKPGQEEALMAATKTSLNRTRCERSMHLCVAPTFVKDDKALWAIVDLTDYRLVGIRWTNVGTTGPAQRVSERKLLFDKIMECNCRQVKSVDRDDWKMNYVLTTSDGLRVSEVYYHDKLVLNSAKLVDWHVSYSGTDGFGYSDAVGCPEFSHAAVLAVSEPRVSDLMENGRKVGFVLEQSFQSEQWPRPCNYNYVQRYEFYLDGRFRTAVASLGRGCGHDGTYRPVTRIEFAGDQNNFSEWQGSDWKPWALEQWRLQGPQTTYTKEGFQYRIADASQQGYYIEPGQGQFADGGRGDNAFVYITRFHADKDEGSADLVTIGPCCNSDYRQGPEKFIEPTPESIEQGRLVMWYVSQLKNDDSKGKEYCWAESYLDNGTYKTKAYPCMSGPMFVPIR